MQRVENKSVILSNDKCNVTQPLLVKKFGRSSALFLQQVNFWLTRRCNVGTIHDGSVWVYNSAKDWADDIGTISEKTVKRAISALRENGVIKTMALNPHKSVRTNYYTINYDLLEEILGVEKGSLLRPRIGEGRASSEPKKRLFQRDKVTLPSGQSGPMLYNDTKITSKKNISSEERSAPKGTDLVPPIEVNQQVKQVVEEKKNNLAEELIKIWNETVGEGKQIVELTKKRAQYLVAAFKLKFESSTEKWREYCKKISSSKFLMGEKTTFRATIDWVIKFDTIQKIIEGAYGIGDRTTSKPVTIDTDQVENQILIGSESEQIKDVRQKLLKAFDGATYISWFKDLSLAFEGQETLRIKTKSRFSFNQIQTRFGDKIRQVLGMRLVWE